MDAFHAFLKSSNEKGHPPLSDNILSLILLSAVVRPEGKMNVVLSLLVVRM